LHVVFSRKRSTRKILELVTDDPERSAAGLIQTDEHRWAVELLFKDRQQLRGLRQHQNRSSGAAVTHLHLVALASALLPHLRLMRHGAQGRRAEKNTAHWSTAAVQDHPRGLLWDDLVAYLQAKHHGESVLLELEQLRVV
jgi:hypothetical protein